MCKLEEKFAPWYTGKQGKRKCQDMFDLTHNHRIFWEMRLELALDIGRQYGIIKHMISKPDRLDSDLIIVVLCDLEQIT